MELFIKIVTGIRFSENYDQAVPVVVAVGLCGRVAGGCLIFLAGADSVAQRLFPAFLYPAKLA